MITVKQQNTNYKHTTNQDHFETTKTNYENTKTRIALKRHKQHKLQTHTKKTRITFKQQQQIEEHFQIWQRKECAKEVFEARAMTLGVTYNPYGARACVLLRAHFAPASVITHDVMHVCFSNGIVGSELYWFFKHLWNKLQIDYSSFRVLIAASWEFPNHRQAKGSDLAQIFGLARVESSAKAENGRHKLQRLWGHTLSSAT